MLRKLSIILIATIFSVLVFFAISVFSFMNSSASKEKTDILFYAKPGPFRMLAQDLERKGLITNSRYFVMLARIQGKASKARVGEFMLNTKQSPQQILNTLVSGKMYQYAVSIPEGYNIYEIANLLESKNLVKADEFLRLAKNKKFITKLFGFELNSLEGYLFPDTYMFTRSDSPSKMIKQMVSRFKKEYEQIVGLPGRIPLSMQEHVSLASVIEKETGDPDERPLIASVFHNRINKGMKLQSDPTILYAIKEATGEWKKNIRKSDILFPSSINTYYTRGLPSSPIANPGYYSLHAAVFPQESEFLYFVSRNDGTHYFSKSYAEHQKAVRDYQLNAKARAGKSWRDLSKNKDK